MISPSSRIYVPGDVPGRPSGPSAGELDAIVVGIAETVDRLACEVNRDEVASIVASAISDYSTLGAPWVNRIDADINVLRYEGKLGALDVSGELDLTESPDLRAALDEVAELLHGVILRKARTG